MDELIQIIGLYSIIFLLLLIVYYLIPVGIMYYIFFVKNREKWRYKRIQKTFPKRSSIVHEIKWSVISLLIFSFYTVVLYKLFINGYTRMYFDIDEYGVIYFILSPFIALIIHDTFFYWAHRFMHLKSVFKYFHLVHHKSINPTPWAVYSFQPMETIFQYAIFPLLLFLLPYHPITFGGFVLYNMFVNTAGHTGFEFLPKNFTRHWFFKWQNPITHHDMHHSKFNCNYGLYFNIWDRIMGTLHDKYMSKFDEVKAKHK